jgi:hypothetical protein
VTFSRQGEKLHLSMMTPILVFRDDADDQAYWDGFNLLKADPALADRKSP